MIHLAQNLCGGDVGNIIKSSFDWSPAGPQKSSVVVFLMGQIEFMRDEIKIKKSIAETLLALKTVLHDNQLSFYNSQKVPKI